MGMFDGCGYDGQQKYTFYDTCGLCQMPTLKIGYT